MNLWANYLRASRPARSPSPVSVEPDASFYREWGQVYVKHFWPVEPKPMIQRTVDPILQHAKFKDEYFDPSPIYKSADMNRLWLTRIHAETFAAEFEAATLRAIADAFDWGRHVVSFHHNGWNLTATMDLVYIDTIGVVYYDAHERSGEC